VTKEFHPPVEEYLQTIASLAAEGRPVIQARIAERLGKAPPSVGEMLDRLEADGYVKRSGRKITLTSNGEATATKVIRRHRLAERMLVDVIGLPWHLVHEEAGRWEHVISDEVEERLVTILDDPGTCPHGNPIPGSANKEADEMPVKLAEMDAGEMVRLVRMSEDVEMDMAAMRYLDEAGFIPGRTAKIQIKAPDNTVILDVKGKTLALGPDFCDVLFVTAA
jgi:DtxR family transcriptional regulator, Mn-dependent transcriptional regulator